MFQSIKYLNYVYDNKTKLYHYQYEITDSNFVSTLSVASTLATEATAEAPAAGAIKEYENRNYKHKEIINNLFLLNMFLLKKWRYKDINKILEYQHEYLIKEYYPETNFREKYYNDLMRYAKKMMVIS